MQVHVVADVPIRGLHTFTTFVGLPAMFCEHLHVSAYRCRPKVHRGTRVEIRHGQLQVHSLRLIEYPVLGDSSSQSAPLLWETQVAIVRSNPNVSVCRSSRCAQPKKRLNRGFGRKNRLMRWSMTDLFYVETQQRVGPWARHHVSAKSAPLTIRKTLFSIGRQVAGHFLGQCHKRPCRRGLIAILALH